MIGIRMNRNTGALSQYLGFDFNSLCVFSGKVLGVNDDGLFELTGDTDNGADIDAFVELPTTDFGSEKQKRVRCGLVGYEADGDLTVTVTLDETTAQSATLSPKKAGSVEQSVKVPLQRTLPGRYVMTRIDNVDGSNFALDAVSLDLVELGRKPR